jgi:signal peptidase I
MSRRSWMWSLGGAGALALIAAAWFLLAPPKLGGSTSYAVIVGSSMEPHLHRGDLALVRPADHYRPGDVVLYRSRLLGHDVLHRIVRVEGDRYVFKGDNNTFIDPDKPTNADIVGKLRVGVPWLGRALEWLRVPTHSAIVAGLAALIALGAGGGATARRRRRSRAATHGPRKRGPLPVLTGAGEVALVVLAVVALGFGLLTAVAFLRSPHSLVLYNGYRQVGTFGYEAPAPAGAAYPSGAATTGQPIFLRLAKNVSIRFDYRFEARSPHAVEGSGRMLADLGDPSVGWRRTLTIQPWTAFKGDRFSARGTLRFDRIESLIARVERETGFGSASHTLTLRPQIRLRGEVAQAHVSDRFDPSLALELDPLVLRLAPRPDGTGVSALTSSRPGALSRLERTELSAFGLHLDAARARLYAPVVAGAALAAALALLVLMLRALRKDEAARIAARYGNRLIAVTKLAPAVRERTIEVARFEDLARLAEAVERPILHEQHNGVHSYLVEWGSALYRYSHFGETETTNDAFSEAVARLEQVTSGPTRTREVGP